MGKGATGVRYFKLKYVGVMSSDGGGIISTYIQANPQLVFNGAGTVEDWTSVSSLFDSFQVRAMKVRYIPSMPNDTSVSTAFKPLYVGFDVDAAGNPVSSVNTAIQYENVKVVNMYRPWTYYVGLPKSGAGKILGWVDVATTTDQRGTIFGYGGGFDLSTDYGTVLITYYIKCKDRR